MKRDKLALINRRWKCKKGKDSRLRLVDSRKLTNMTISPVPFPAVTVTVVPDHAKNQSDCRIAYSALLGKNKRIYFGCCVFLNRSDMEFCFIAMTTKALRVLVLTLLELGFPGV